MTTYTAWTVEEDLQLLGEMEAGIDVKRIARQHGRSLGAIKSRISKHRFRVEFVERLEGHGHTPIVLPLRYRLLRYMVIILIKRWGLL